MGLKVNPPPKFLCAWEAKANNTSYLAETDGFVTATTETQLVAIVGLTDGDDPPTTTRIVNMYYGGEAGRVAGIFMPVKRGDYWKVTNANVVWWIPFNY